MKHDHIDFTNREKITKSLKFEAIPEEATMQAIKRDHLMEDNAEMLAKAKELETYVDIAIKEIMCKALSHVTFDAWELYMAYQNASTDKKTYTEKTEALTKEILSTFQLYLPKGMKKIADINSATFIKDIMPELLKSADISEEEKETGLRLLEEVKSPGSLMNKFLTTRVTTVSTWMPQRVIENFEIFAKNMDHVKQFLDAREDPQIATFLEDYPTLRGFDSADYYEYCLHPDDINAYNSVISGLYCEDGSLEKKGYNQFVNELNTKHKNDPNYDGPFYRGLKPLYQQILMPKPKCFSIEKLENDEDLRELLREVKTTMPVKQFDEIVDLIRSADQRGVMIDGKNLHALSALVYGKHETIPNAVKESLASFLEDQIQNTDNKTAKKEFKQKLESLNEDINKSVYSFEYLEDKMADPGLFDTYIRTLMRLVKNIENCTEILQVERILGNRKIFGRKDAKNIIKNYTQSMLDFRSAVKVIIPNRDSDEQDIMFYEKLNDLCEPLATCVKAFNLCRNYLTAAPKDLATENIMCFGQPLLLQNTWWKTSTPKMKSGMCAILEKDGKYYYIIKSPAAKPVDIALSDKDTGYHVLSYIKGQDAGKLFAKTVFSKDVKAAFESGAKEVRHPFVEGLTVTREQYDFYMDKTYSLESVRKGIATEEERRYALATMIDLYKSVIPLYESTACFDFDLKDTGEYNDIGLFMDDCNRFMNKAEWVSVDKESMDANIAAGTLLSFLITNRNMYKDDNVKTTYAQTFLYMMSDDNLKNMNFRLNAKPTMTFRPACLPLEITHPKGSILVNKNDSRGKKIPGNAYVELLDYFNGRRSQISKEAKEYEPYCVTKVADYDIAKNRRYMFDKFFISFSYGVNSDLPDRARNTISEEVAEEIKNGCRVLSVVRGTSDMLYYVLYDEKRNIIEKRSLNVIGGTDYCALLRQLTMENRSEMADNWGTPIRVEKIKESYVNFAISEIMDVARKNNAVIVIEKLDEHFKDKMSLVDNQVYKIFETKLKSRLLDYRNKKIPMGQPGSICLPLQFSKKAIGNPTQNGILFELNGAYTKNMDATGFTDLFNWNNLNTIAAKRRFLSQLDIQLVGDDQELNMIVFDFDYKNFSLRNNIKAEDLDKTTWSVYAGKPCTIYDGTGYKLVQHPARDIVRSLITTDPEKMSNEQVRQVFDLFKKTIKTTSVKKCHGNKQEHYSSPTTPVDDKTLSSAENTARNLAKKLYYCLDRAEDDTDFTIGWLNYAIA